VEVSNFQTLDGSVKPVKRNEVLEFIQCCNHVPWH